MSTITLHLTEADATTFRSLARLAGKAEGHLARELVQAYLRSSLADPDIRAGLRAVEKLSGHWKSPQPAARKVEPRPRDSSALSSPGLPRPSARGGGRRSVHNRDLANLPDGVEVSFRGTRARIVGGKMHIDGGEPFDSPSAAAVYVAGGGSFNGWKDWKADDGTELRELHRRHAG